MPNHRGMEGLLSKCYHLEWYDLKLALLLEDQRIITAMIGLANTLSLPFLSLSFSRCVWSILLIVYTDNLSTRYLGTGSAARISIEFMRFHWQYRTTASRADGQANCIAVESRVLMIMPLLLQRGGRSCGSN